MSFFIKKEMLRLLKNTILVTVQLTMALDDWIVMYHSNTTLVIIQQGTERTSITGIDYSNTTLVIVQLQHVALVGQQYKSKYNSCYCSTRSDHKRDNRECIQIQLLLLFNQAAHIRIALRRNSNTTLIIVHLALQAYAGLREGFKYNICYCSTQHREVYQRIQQNSNTTLVIVQHSLDAICFGIGLIQIQLLLLFSSLRYLQVPEIQPFKYNSCYCSAEAEHNREEDK